MMSVETPIEVLADNCLSLGEGLEILLVEDSPVDQILMDGAISAMGHHVTVTSSAEEALRIMHAKDFQLVITDWRMPGMSGVEFCEKVRRNQDLKNVYIIIATGKNRREDLLAGLEAGADDFLSKPVDPEELRVRMKSAIRIVKLQEQEQQKNLALTASLAREEQTNAAIREGLDTAAMMQQKLLPDHRQIFSSIKTASVFQPAEWIAGDGLSVFPINEKTLGFYSIDVSGHGLASAMLSFAVTQILSLEASRAAESLLKHDNSIDPAAVVSSLNHKFAHLETVHHYFTMVYGMVDVESGEGSLCQAGHPHPLICRNNQRIQSVGSAGFPVGLLQEADFHSSRFSLTPGDRLFVHSDGIADSPNLKDETFGVQRFKRTIAQVIDLPLTEAVDRIGNELSLWRSNRAPEDDISLLAIEFLP